MRRPLKAGRLTCSGVGQSRGSVITSVLYFTAQAITLAAAQHLEEHHLREDLLDRLDIRVVELARRVQIADEDAAVAQARCALPVKLLRLQVRRD